MPNQDENRLFNPTLIVLTILVIAGGLGGGLWFALRDSGGSGTGSKGPAIQLVEEKPKEEKKSAEQEKPKPREEQPREEPVTPSAETVTLTGQVFIGDTPRAAADVRVEAFIADNKEFRNARSVETKTDVSGAFKFADLPRQHVWLRASGEGYPREHAVSHDARFNLAEGVPTDIVLHVVPGVSMEGKVVSAIGEPIAGAVVTAIEGYNAKKEYMESAPVGGKEFQISGLVFRVNECASTTTGPDGAFKLNGLEPGTYEAVAYAPGFAWASVKDAPTQGAPVEFRLEPEAQVVGTVRMLPSNQLVSNATIAVTANVDSRGLAGNLISGATGAYRISNLPRRYSMKISATDGAVESVEYELRGSGLAVEIRKDLLLISNRQVTGRVVRGFDGLPLGDVELSVMDSFTGQVVAAGAAKTDAEGKFAFTTGKQSVEFTLKKAGGYQPATGRAQFLTDDPTLDLPDIVMVYGVPVSGRVIDQNSKRGVAKARVQAFPVDKSIDLSQGAESNAAGDYAFKFVPPGKYYFSATAPGFQAGFYGNPDSATEGFHPIVTVGLEKPLTGMDITVVPAQNSSVSGFVVDSSGTGIAGAEVFLSWWTHSEKTQTDGEGQFSFEKIPIGPYTLGANAPGYSPQEMAVNVSASRPLEGVRLMLMGESTLSISGLVTDEAGRPLGPDGYRVRVIEGRMEKLFAEGKLTPDGLPADGGIAKSHRVALEPNGSYEVPGLAPGKYTVFAQSDSAVDVRYDVDAGATGVDFQLHSGHTLKGRVLLPDGGSPATTYNIHIQQLSEANTKLLRKEESQRVQSPDGSFEFDALPEGVYTVTVQSKGVGEASVFGVEVGPELNPDLTIILNGGGAFVGKISGPEGKPLPGVKVELGEVSKRTGPDGSFGFSGLAPDRYAITASHPDYAPLLVPAIPLTQGQRIDLGTLSLTKGGKLKGRVRYSSGAGAGGFTVKAEPTGGMLGSSHTNSLTSSTDGAGYYLIPNMPQGSFRVVAQMYGGPSRAKVANVMAGQDAVVDFTVDQGSTVTGRVTVKGQALGQSTLVFYPRGGSDLSELLTYTDGSGNYRLEGVPPGNYEAVAAEFSPLVEVPLRTSVTVPDQPTFQQDFSF